MVYRWKPGAHVKLDPQITGEHLEKLRIANDGLTPALVVEDARRPESPIHDGFEWDDVKAGQQWRLTQAGHIIRTVTVVMHDGGEREQETRAFVVVSDDAEERNIYTSVTVAMADDKMRAQVIARAMRELDAWQRKYREVRELADIFRVIESTRKVVTA